MTSSWLLLDQMVTERDKGLKKYLDKSIPLPPTSHQKIAAPLQHLVFYQMIDASYIDLFLSKPAKEDLSTLKSILFSDSPSNLKQYLEEHLFQTSSQSYDLLPYSHFPSFENEEILAFNAPKMHKLVLLLGLYDLKTTLRVIIDQKVLGKIRSCLPPFYKHFLENIQHEKDKIEFKKIPLESWDETFESLQNHLYLRGINRLAKGFSHEPDYLKNELLLRLPMKDSGHFKALATPLDTGLISVLRNQINAAIESINQAS